MSYISYKHFSTNKLQGTLHKNLFPGSHHSHISKTLSSYCQHAFCWQCWQHTQGSRYVVQDTVRLGHHKFCSWWRLCYICISRHDEEELAVSLIKQQFFPTFLVKTNVHPNWTILSWMPKCIAANVQCNRHISTAISNHYSGDEGFFLHFYDMLHNLFYFPWNAINCIFYFFVSNNSHFFI